MSPFSRISAVDVELETQVAELARAGVPLASGLSAVADELPRGRTSRALRRLSVVLEAGTPVDVAVEAAASCMPAHIRALLVSGLRCGDLGEVLHRFLEQQRAADDVRRRAWLALSYPLVLLLFVLCWFSFMLIWFARPMVTLVKEFEFEFERSLVSRDLVWMAEHAEMMSAMLLLWTVGLLLLPLLFGGVRGLSALLGTLPLVGRLWKFQAVAQFTGLLALLLDRRLPLAEAVRLSAAATNDAEISWSGKKAAAHIEDGRSLAQSLARFPAFPATLIPLVQWGESHSTLPEALESASQLYVRRAELQAQVLRSVLPPFIMLLLGLVVIFMMRGVVTPITSMFYFLM